MESRNGGRQKFVAVTIPQATSNTPPSTSAAVVRSAANRAATASSQVAPILKALRRRIGLGGSGGAANACRMP